MHCSFGVVFLKSDKGPVIQAIVSLRVMDTLSGEATVSELFAPLFGKWVYLKGKALAPLSKVVCIKLYTAF